MIRRFSESIPGLIIVKVQKKKKKKRGDIIIFQLKSGFVGGRYEKGLSLFDVGIVWGRGKGFSATRWQISPFRGPRAEPLPSYLISVIRTPLFNLGPLISWSCPFYAASRIFLAVLYSKTFDTSASPTFWANSRKKTRKST